MRLTPIQLTGVCEGLGLREKCGEIVDNPVLDSIESGSCGREFFIAYSMQRYLAARRFVDLLKSASVREGINFDLKRELVVNIRDEEGLHENGSARHSGSHEKWRRDYYTRLGIEELNLVLANPNFATSAYDSTLSILIREPDLRVVIGAIAMQEFSIPFEFFRIAQGRDTLFPDEFVRNIDDDREVTRQKSRARLYLDDHIRHDSAHHFPDLQRAINRSFNPDDIPALSEGARLITDARVAFYQGFDVPKS